MLSRYYCYCWCQYYYTNVAFPLSNKHSFWNHKEIPVTDPWLVEYVGSKGSRVCDLTVRSGQENYLACCQDNIIADWKLGFMDLWQATCSMESNNKSSPQFQRSLCSDVLDNKSVIIYCDYMQQIWKLFTWECALLYFNFTFDS